MSRSIQRELVKREMINVNPDRTQQRGGKGIPTTRSSGGVRSPNLNKRAICKMRVPMTVSIRVHETTKPMDKSDQVKNGRKPKRMSTKLSKNNIVGGEFVASENAL